MNGSSARGSNLYDYRSKWEFQDDLGVGETTSGRIGAMGWNAAGTIGFSNGSVNFPGALNVATGTSINAIGRINMFGATVISSANDLYLKWRVRLNSVDANTIVRAGFSDGWSTDPQNMFIGVEYLGADTNFFGVSTTSGTPTRVNTLLAKATGIFTLAFRKIGASATMTVKPDGGSEFTVTIASGVPTFVGSFGMHIKTTEAVNKSFDIDYVEGGVYNMTR